MLTRVHPKDVEAREKQAREEQQRKQLHERNQRIEDIVMQYNEGAIELIEMVYATYALLTPEEIREYEERQARLAREIGV